MIISLLDRTSMNGADWWTAGTVSGASTGAITVRTPVRVCPPPPGGTTTWTGRGARSSFGEGATGTKTTSSLCKNVRKVVKISMLKRRRKKRMFVIWSRHLDRAKPICLGKIGYYFENSLFAFTTIMILMVKRGTYFQECC